MSDPTRCEDCGAPLEEALILLGASRCHECQSRRMGHRRSNGENPNTRQESE